ncbi:MAG: hypothetical protein RLZZ46_1123 [Bacteroidota bacterium]|jgi:hypothetical protein
MDPDFERQWNEVIEEVSHSFGEKLDLESVLFLIGVQELGQPSRKFSKDQKVDLMHIAICRLLEPFGYYTYEGNDPDGWPHYKATDMLPSLNPGQQHQLMKRAVVEYFRPEKPLSGDKA